MRADEYGSVIEVSTVNVGATVAVDASIGATTLTLSDVSVFEELGGQVWINSEIYVYTAINLTLNTMTLFTGLLAAAAANDDRVEIYPPAPFRTAMVKFGIEDAEAVRVIIPHYFSGMPDGVREAPDQELALVEQRNTGELYLKDVATKGMTVLGPGTNLDEYTSQGVFICLKSANALVSGNFPAQTVSGAYAGVLEVLATKPGDIMVQRYTAYRNPQIVPYPSSWTRVFGSGAWSAWVAVMDDTGWITSTGSIGVAQTGWSFTSGNLRRIGKFVTIALIFTYTGAGITVPANGNVTNDPVVQMVAAYRPGGGFSQGGLSTISTGRAATFSITFDGVISLTAVSGPTVANGGVDIATNDTFSCGGTYLMD